MDDSFASGLTWDALQTSSSSTDDPETLPLPTTIIFSRPQKIGVIGAGRFGCALAKRMVTNGIPVVLGSRSGKSKYACACPVASMEEAIKQSLVVFLCIPSHAYMGFVKTLNGRLNGKVIVDVSKSKSSKSESSTAEQLQEHLSSIGILCHVVKGFSNISANAMESDHDHKRTVYLSGSEAGKAPVERIASQLGFEVADLGELNTARDHEHLSSQFFHQWIKAMLAASAMFVFFLIYNIIFYHILDMPSGYPGANKPIRHWRQLPLTTMNKVLGMVSINMIAAVYLPGAFARFLQLARWSSFAPLPRWLVDWMLVRKQLGLVGLWFMAVHALMSLFVFSSAQHASPFYKEHEEEENVMSLYGELAFMFGILAISLFLVMAVASLPDVSASMTWKEWHFIQGILGQFALALSLIHNILIMVAYSTCGDCPTFGDSFERWPGGVIPPGWISTWLPALTVFLRLLFGLPPLRLLLQHIKRNSRPSNSLSSQRLI